MQQALPSNHRFNNLTGAKFGRLMVIGFGFQKNKKSYWLCKCDCGNTTTIRSDGLTTGHAKSCGCLQKEIVTNNVVEMNTVHGMSGSRFYNIYLKMKSRCHNETDARFNDYGGRGISVSEEWHDFEKFKSDMYESYKAHCEKHGIRNTTIDRMNNDRGYSKKNCRWATMKIQANNRRERRAGSKVNQYK